jgi:chitin disaccharide deacetylase
MLIINADDLGRDRETTNAVLACHRHGTISSASAMVFMADSRRAAEQAARGGLDTGLHLNLSLPFDGPDVPSRVRESQLSVSGYLGRGKWPQVVYNPFLRTSLIDAYRDQVEEFRRLFGQEPAQIDGHSHMHLSLNMIIGRIIPPGLRIRRTFTFHRGEKSPWNRLYRRWLDHRVLSRYRTTDSFFSIEPISDRGRVARIVGSALSSNIELMVHPADAGQRAYLMSREFLDLVRDVPKGSFRNLS